MTIKQKIACLRQIVTVEPVIATYVIIRTNRTLIEAGLKNSFNLCDVTTLDCTLSYRFLQYFLLPAVLLLFLAHYSDRYSLRKPFLLLPLFGELFSIVGYALCTAYETCPPYLYTILQIVPACCGGFPMVWTMACAYISDITNVENRTFRLGILDAMPFLSDVVVNQFGVFGHTRVEIFYPFWGGVILLAILYGIYMLEEPKNPEVGEFLQAFNPKNIKKIFNTLLIKRPYRGRSLILVLLCLVFVHVFILTGSADLIEIHYVKIVDLGSENYHQFRKYVSLILLVGHITSLCFLVKLAKLDDMTILFINLTCSIVSNNAFGFARSLPMLYAAEIVGATATLLPTISKSIMAKSVSSEDYAKIFTLFSLCHALGIVLPDRNRMFSFNTDYQPGLFFYSGIFLINFILVLSWIHVRNIKDRRRERITNICLNNQVGYEIVSV